MPPVQGYFYSGLLLSDGKGMAMVMSTPKADDLGNYARTALLSNRTFSEGTGPLEWRSVGKRQTLFTTFTSQGSSGKVWFFEEGGRQVTFFTLGTDASDSGEDLLKALEVHPAEVEAELGEEELLASLRSISEALSAQDEQNDSQVRIQRIEVLEGERRIIFYFLCTLPKDSLDNFREMLRDREGMLSSLVLSVYERRAIELGYTIGYVYREKNQGLIGQLEFSSGDFQGK